MIVQLLNALAMNAGHETGSGRRKMAGRSLDSRMTHEQSNLKKRWKGAALVCFLFFAVWLAFPAPGTSQETSEKAPVTQQQANPDAGQSSKADDTDKKAGADHVLDEMVVTATRTATPLSQVPASVSVVTKADLDKRNVQSVNSAVDFVPGLFDKQAKPLDTTSRVIIRGIPDQKRNLVLLDGLPINDAYTGVTNWNGMLPENLERIEVARGPFSSLYGGNAM
ncbi:MAG TPA: Plug domain-containing protein, partial [Syntrophobacteraceae bacterium]|nr:Plug domain-containing protein [Syntrophobacteraceae bacterium]